MILDDLHDLCGVGFCAWDGAAVFVFLFLRFRLNDLHGIGADLCLILVDHGADRCLSRIGLGVQLGCKTKGEEADLECFHGGFRVEITGVYGEEPRDLQKA